MVWKEKLQRSHLGRVPDGCHTASRARRGVRPPACHLLRFDLPAAQAQGQVAPSRHRGTRKPVMTVQCAPHEQVSLLERPGRWLCYQQQHRRRRPQLRGAEHGVRRHTDQLGIAQHLQRGMRRQSEGKHAAGESESSRVFPARILHSRHKTLPPAARCIDLLASEHLARPSAQTLAGPGHSPP